MQIPKEVDFEVQPSFGLKAWVTEKNYIALANCPTIGDEDEGIVLITTSEARALIAGLQGLIDLAETPVEIEEEQE